MREIGVDLKIEFNKNNIIVDECHGGMRNICVIHWGMRDPADMVNLFASDNIGTGFNWSHWDSEKADQLMDDGAKEPDREKRERIYQELQKLILDDMSFFPVFVTPSFWAQSVSVMDLEYLPSGRHVWFYDTYINK